MKAQQGVSVIYFIVVLVLAIIGYVGYEYNKKHKEDVFNEQSYQTLKTLKTKLDDKIAVAQSTPRIGLGAVLNDLATIKTDITTVSVSKCLQPAKDTLINYSINEIKVIADFVGDGETPKEEQEKKYSEYMTNKEKAQKEFNEKMNLCAPK